MAWSSKLNKMLAWGAAAGVAVGTWQVYRGAQQRRRSQRRRIDALREAEPGEAALRAYLTLHTELDGDAHRLQDLRSLFDPEWLPLLRAYLGRQLGAGHLDQAHDWLTQLEWEWQQAVGEQTLCALRTLVTHLRQPVPQPSPDVLRQIVAGFQAAGLGATRPVVQWFQRVQPAPGAVREVLFREGGAAGRYLLARWAEQSDEAASLLQRWEQEVRLPVPGPQAAGLLWPSARGESRLVEAGVRRLGLDLNPFGPEKAEQDPALPDLFYRISPLWEELVALQPAAIVAPPGSGRSALIWMLRYECGLVGSAVEHVFPVYVPIYTFSSPEEAQATIRHAVATAVCQALAGNPYDLLGLGDAPRQGLAGLLLRDAGGVVPLLRDLHLRGLDEGDPDAQLLAETLTLEARSLPPGVEGGDGYVPQFHPYGRAYTFLLIDLFLKEADQLQDLVDLFLTRWLVSWTPRHLVPKVFLPSRPKSCSPSLLELCWDADALRRLLWHRLERAGLVLPADGPALQGWIDGVDDPDGALVEAAGGSPAQLVRLGNRLIRRLAQPQLLRKQEFLGLLKDRELI
jgi:hypothetical protein